MINKILISIQKRCYSLVHKKSTYYNSSDFYSSDKQSIENFKITRGWFPFGVKPVHLDMLDGDVCNWSDELYKYIIYEFLLNYWKILNLNELNHSTDINHVILVFIKIELITKINHIIVFKLKYLKKN
uniref:Uncharacterized protein n=1 Tax=Orbilia brochopaga TaxID=3140254 RepID=A0A481ZLC6_9PEZI|nr:hypothetical protein [Drechslerella brochopaga]QBL02540.1 hypothetical protein [Drechslerella brochopaga]